VSFIPSGDGQRQILETEARLTVVVGGAGTGKTTAALAAAERHLNRDGALRHERALFLSFSRASVSRIGEQGKRSLGDSAKRIDVLTFHALAYSIVRRFGSTIGQTEGRLVSPARVKLGKRSGDLEYGDLIPMALRILNAAPAVVDALRSRWTLVIVDEFQDTGDLQQELLDAIAPDARRMLLGDPNQCIYTFLAADGVKLERIAQAMRTAGADNSIKLPDTSFRDPSGVIPGVARAIQQREFSAPVLKSAIDSNRLLVQSGIDLRDETAVVSEVVRREQSEGHGVAVFTHHNDMLAQLSDALEKDGIEHDIAGLSDALAGALDAQVAMLSYASGLGSWDDVLDAVAVFITSASRGKAVPPLALNVVHGTGPASLGQRLAELRSSLPSATDAASAIEAAHTAHTALGLPSKWSAWDDASRLLRTMHARARRELGTRASSQVIVRAITSAAREATIDSLTDSTLDAHSVQLMNLYQTKGREADVTVVVLRQTDFLGVEREPFEAISRLLYVVFSRARIRIVVLLIGDQLPPAVAPLAMLASK
jgi:DNA helicase-2/ATP-dependent DNA helicase PcrA